MFNEELGTAIISKVIDHIIDNDMKNDDEYTDSVPIIYVFESKNSKYLMKKLSELGYAPFYDGIHKFDYEWLSKNITNDHIFYNFDTDHGAGMNNFGCNEDLYGYDPHIVIIFKQDVVLLDEERECLLYWLSDIDDLPDQKYNHDIAERLMKKPCVQKITVTVDENEKEAECNGFKGLCTSISPSYKPIEKCYTFDKRFIKARDTMLYQIIRPGTEMPFTVVIEKFSVYGVKRLFSDIYGCKDWDMNRMECRYDYTFLTNLWKHLKLEGEFTMNIVKERVDACYPGRLGEGILPESEPIVYRKDIDGVLDILLKRDLSIEDTKFART